MGKVVVKALAGSSYLGDDKLVDRSKLDGIDCQDGFVEYMDQPLKSKLSGGYMDFRFENGELWTYTTYSSKAELTESELKELIDYTQGQWSDGIGEGFEQFPCYDIDGEDVYLSPWYPGQKAEAIQD